MRYEAKMMPMFLTVYLSNNDQHFTEVPVTPDTLCRDVVELCKEAGESDCYLAEMWRGSERVVGEAERMLDILQRWGQQRVEVRFFLRHERPPSRDSGGSRAPEHLANRNGVKGPMDRRMENGVASPRMDMTLAELQEMASRQQQQIDAQQQLLASKEQRLRYLKQQDQRQQQATEQETLRRLRENAEGQEARLRKVRALKGQVEQKRLGNGKLVEEIEQMSSLFQQKQRELVAAVSKVEDLSRQLDILKNSKMDAFHDNQSSAAELDRMYKELQLRNRLNQEQSARLQQQRDSLNKRNLEVAAMDRRVGELRDRLWKKKAALQQKENLPNGIPIKDKASKGEHHKLPGDGNPPQQNGPARVAAVGPYRQSATMPRGSMIGDALLKPAYPDSTATLPVQESPLKAQTRGRAPGDDSELQKRDRDKKVRPLSMFESTGLPTTSLRKNQSSEDLVRDAQNSGPGLVKVPPPVASKPKQVTLPPGIPPAQPTYGRPAANAGTFPGKAKAPGQHPPHSQTLPLPPKQEPPLAAAVRPFTPEPGPQGFRKPPSAAASSIYSMYTKQAAPGKGLQSVQGALTRAQSRPGPFPSVYGKPVVPGAQHSQAVHPENPYSETDQGLPAPPVERSPRPLSPTKLLPFISGPYRQQSDGDLEALRRKLYHAPRPLKKRSSITEPEGPAGPNIQKLLYQKTTLAAMETTATSTPFDQPGPPRAEEVAQPDPAPQEAPAPEPPPTEPIKETDSEDFVPPPPPSHPAPTLGDPESLPAPLVLPEEEDEPEPAIPPPPESFLEEFPPYPPPPYPSGAEQDSPGQDPFSMKAPEVTGQVTLPPGKRTNLRKTGSERIDHGMRVRFNPLALLLDSSLEGEFDLVQRIIYEVDDPSLPNDEGITALHNAVCAGHTEIVKFLVQYGVNVNAADSDGWTPLHCAASCNNVQVCKFLVESGAAVFAMTYSDMQTAADKCEEMEEGYAQCSQFLYGVQEKMGIMNRGMVYALWDYEQEEDDELVFREGDCMTILRREDEDESEWWWAHMGDVEGYIPRNLLGLYPRIKPRQRSLA
ncbi:hypothetical protein COCON_G00227440 [Conger conger]|uniref:Uncharacterized protein n=1 Tax=Conger conger TaxID=82655 RepID=A0A9Q1CXT6_CONCO|nr:hypothetical protein COCON_G00227440 [Conger conger]